MADTSPVLTAKFALRFHDLTITSAGGTLSLRGPHEGELTRSLVVVPQVAVNLPEAVELFPSEKPKKIEIAVKANVAGAAGELRLDLPPGWRAEPCRAVRVSDAGRRELSWHFLPAVAEPRTASTPAYRAPPRRRSRRSSPAAPGESPFTAISISSAFSLEIADGLRQVHRHLGHHYERPCQSPSWGPRSDNVPPAGE